MAAPWRRWLLPHIVANGTGYARCMTLATDGTQVPLRRDYSCRRCEFHDCCCQCLVRLGEVKRDVLTWKSTVTAAQKLSAYKQMLANNVVARRNDGYFFVITSLVKPCWPRLPKCNTSLASLRRGSSRVCWMGRSSPPKMYRLRVTTSWLLPWYSEQGGHPDLSSSAYFLTNHYRVDGAVYADEVLNMRGMWCDQ